MNRFTDEFQILTKSFKFLKLEFSMNYILIKLGPARNQIRSKSVIDFQKNVLVL